MSDELREAVEYVNGTPTPRLLLNMFHSNMTHAKALAELVDNAFDAAATSVEIQFGPTHKIGARELSVRDNGIGCAQIAAMVLPGDHEQHPGTKLGRYGIGMKDAATWEGGERSLFHIVSTANGVTRECLHDWHGVLTAREWPQIKVLVRPAAATDRGTLLRISPVIRTVPTGADWERLRAHLGYMYAPGLNRGRQILMGRGGRQATPVQAWRLPKFDSNIPPVDCSLMIGKRNVRIRAGVVKEGESNPHPGLTYWHAFRVILESTNRGCGNYGTGRIAGVVELDESWPLTRNKDDVSRDAEALADGVFSVLHPLLLRAQDQSMSVRFRNLEDKIGRRLEEALGTLRRKARRPGSTDQVGTKKETGAGGPHKRATITQPGERFRGASGASMRVTFVALGDDDIAGRFEGGSEVQLNIDCPAISKYRNVGNDDALTTIAISLVAEHCTRHESAHNGQRTLWSVHDFTKSLGTLLKAMHQAVGNDDDQSANGAVIP